MSFICSIPDVAFTSWRGNLLRLTGVCTNETYHIARMVHKQYGGTTKIIRDLKHVKSRITDTRSMSTRLEEPGYIPNNIRQQVRETLLLYPNGIEPDSFTHAYRNRFGHWLQYPRLGYNSVRDFLRSMPGVTFERVKNRELVFYSAAAREKPKSWISRSELLSPSDPSFSESKSPPPPNESHTGVLSESENTDTPVETPPPVQFESSTAVPPESSLPCALVTTHERKYEKISQEVSEILSDQLDQIRLEFLETEYLDRFGAALPFPDFGFSSPLELIESLWDTCQLDRRRSGVFVGYIDRSKVQTGEPLTAERRFSLSRVDPEIGQRVRRLLQQWPSGLPYSLITEKYKNRYREHLPVLELGFRDSLHMMRDIPDFVKTVPWSTGSGDTHYILIAVPLKDEPEEQTSHPLVSVDDADAGGLDVPFDKQPIPSSWEFNVYLPFISTPEKFWIQIVGVKTSSATDALVHDMTQFYNGIKLSDLQRYRISRPKVGQSCVAPYQRDSCYYRARVLRIPHPDQAEVYYVDYGNKSRVPIGSLRKIGISNMFLPAQAIRCRLANLRPARGSQWPSGAADLLKDLANDSELFCRVQSVDPDETLSVALYDPSSDCEQSLNQVLIDRGIALHEVNTPTNPGPSKNVLTSTQTPLVYPPPAPSVPVLYSQPPAIMPPPYYYPNYPFYHFPSHPFVNHLPPFMPPPQTHSYMPYTPPGPIIQDRSYLSASVPTPEVLMGPRFNGRGDQARFGEQRFESGTGSLELCQEMGTFEKVQKFLSTHKTPDELEIQMGADREKLKPNSPSPDPPTPLPTIPSSPTPPPTQTTRNSQGLTSQGQIIKCKYKGIGRGGKMSDLV